jgi:MFS family permease
MRASALPRQPRLWLVGVGLIGELLIGGIVFGWNAMSIVLKDLGTYDDACGAEAGATAGDNTCDSQESKLSIVWNAGVFAVNFGPAIIGPMLDIVGPRAVSSAGASLVVGGLVIVGALSTPQLC